MSRSKLAGLHLAFDACREIIHAEGRDLTVREMRSLMQDRFATEIEQYSALIHQAGLNSVIRRMMKNRKPTNSYSSGQIALMFQLEADLPQCVAIPGDDPHVATDWKDLADCTLRDLSAAIRHLKQQISNDGAKKRSLEILERRARSFVGANAPDSLTISDIIRLIND